MDRWIDGYMDGWMDGRRVVFVLNSSRELLYAG